jgi:hypothetical protein
MVEADFSMEGCQIVAGGRSVSCVPTDGAEPQTTGYYLTVFHLPKNPGPRWCSLVERSMK